MRVKGLHVSKRFKEIKFDGISGKLDSNLLPYTMTHKIFETNFSFLGKLGTAGKV